MLTLKKSRRKAAKKPLAKWMKNKRGKTQIVKKELKNGTFMFQKSNRILGASLVSQW